MNEERVEQLENLIRLETERFERDGKPWRQRQIEKIRSEILSLTEHRWDKLFVPAIQREFFRTLPQYGPDALPSDPAALAAMSRVLRIPVADLVSTANEYPAASTRTVA